MSFGCMFRINYTLGNKNMQALAYIIIRVIPVPENALFIYKEIKNKIKIFIHFSRAGCFLL